MDYRDLRAHRRTGAAFYTTALTYAQYLWTRGLPARAILALARGLYTDLGRGAQPPLPVPYAALQWICTHHPPGRFLGNPRLSFQHQARRMRGPRLKTRRARAWAAWKVCATALPHLPDDEADPRPPPEPAAIADALHRHGYPGEADEWLAVIGRSGFRQPT
ncbi:MAG: hypothetical protein JJU00_05310 [Opitutales bacterium]|nr:hypothetical protein [Opitutales bacterium]